MSETERSEHLPVGDRLEEFEIQSVLGEGGFGVVYRAWDHTLNQRRAIKEFLPGLVAQRGGDGRQVTARSGAYRSVYQQGLKRFLDEARTLAELDHPNIVRVHRILEAHGTAYLVMSYYEGRTLAEVMAEGPPKAERVQRLLTRILDGLRAVHERGLLHRDIKPENIYLIEGPEGGEERPVLLDFGAARRVVVEGSRSSLNNAYTPGYAAIEQYGESTGAIKEGPWTDLYGLGATLYHWITGNKPWAAPDRVLDDRLKPLSEIAPRGYSKPWLVSVDRALALKPGDRFESVAAWQMALGRSHRSEGPAGPGVPRRGLWPVALLLGFGVAVAGGGYGIWQYQIGAQQRQQDEATRQQAAAETKRRQDAEAAAETARQQAAAETKRRQDAEAAAETARQQAAAETKRRQAQLEEEEQRRRQELAGPMVRISASCFRMGSPSGEKGRDSDEKLEAQVCIGKDFEIGQHEVTVGQFRRFVAATNYRTDAEKNADGKEGCYIAYREGSEWIYGYRAGSSWKNPNFEQEDDHPVVCVSWNDAQAYVKWLSKKTDQTYQLPTEAEWEYAARAGTTTARYWGDDPNQACRYANVADRTAKKTFSDWTIHECADGVVYTAAVGSFEPNAWKLYDMLGNVWEWTCSAYDEDYGDAKKECTNKNTTGPLAVRGGSWDGPTRWGAFRLPQQEHADDPQPQRRVPSRQIIRTL